MKRVIRELNYYKVYDDDRLIYETTEGRLLIHWVERHPDTYHTDDSINMRTQLKLIRAEHPRLMEMFDERTH